MFDKETEECEADIAEAMKLKCLNSVRTYLLKATFKTLEGTGACRCWMIRSFIQFLNPKHNSGGDKIEECRLQPSVNFKV